MSGISRPPSNGILDTRRGILREGEIELSNKKAPENRGFSILSLDYVPLEEEA